MDAVTQERLRKIVGMMGSDNDGERANAARAFHKIATTSGNTIDKLFAPKPFLSPGISKLMDTNKALEATVTTQDLELKVLRHDARMLIRVQYELDALSAFVSEEVAKLARTEGIRAAKEERLTGRPAWKRT